MEKQLKQDCRSFNVTQGITIEEETIRIYNDSEYFAHIIGYTGKITEEELTDKIKGAWYGRICGCLLGKPVECIRSNELIPLLKETGNYPMHRYILSTDLTEEIVQKTTFKDVAGIDEEKEELSEEVLELITKYPNVYGTLGIHPEEVDNISGDSFRFIEENINNPTVKNKDLTDIFPVVFYNDTVSAASNAARYVLQTAK